MYTVFIIIVILRQWNVIQMVICINIDMNKCDFEANLHNDILFWSIMNMIFDFLVRRMTRYLNWIPHLHAKRYSLCFIKISKLKSALNKNIILCKKSCKNANSMPISSSLNCFFGITNGPVYNNISPRSTIIYIASLFTNYCGNIIIIVFQ